MKTNQTTILILTVVAGWPVMAQVESKLDADLFSVEAQQAALDRIRVAIRAQEFRVTSGKRNSNLQCDEFLRDFTKGTGVALLRAQSGHNIIDRVKALNRCEIYYRQPKFDNTANWPEDYFLDMRQHFGNHHQSRFYVAEKTSVLFALVQIDRADTERNPGNNHRFGSDGLYQFDERSCRSNLIGDAQWTSNTSSLTLVQWRRRAIALRLNEYHDEKASSFVEHLNFWSLTLRAAGANHADSSCSFRSNRRSVR